LADCRGDRAKARQVAVAPPNRHAPPRRRLGAFARARYAIFALVSLPLAGAPLAAADVSPAAAKMSVLSKLSFLQPQPPGLQPHTANPLAAQADASAGSDPLRDPDAKTFEMRNLLAADRPEPWVPPFREPTIGYAGRSGVTPTETQGTSHFVPVEDRWRLGFPAWDRDGRGHPVGKDAPYTPGRWFDPYNQSVIKGDYPVVGQHTFMTLTANSDTILEGRQIPTGTTAFESTRRSHQEEFFGKPNQFLQIQNTSVSLNLLHGDSAFKPADWQIRLTPVFNDNYLAVQELGIVGPNVQDGTTRARSFVALQEWFFESKIADYGPNYDFASARVGSQAFTSDFRGFVFSDVNRMVRLFGTRFSNRDQFNLIWVDQTEKDTNSFLNTFQDRHQNTTIANYYRQDFIFPGYTTQLSMHYNVDGPSVKYDNNGFLARPDPVGVFAPHQVQACYLGWAGDGHVNRLNITHQFYYVTGHDDLNPLAGRSQLIDAYMAAAELSYDADWARFRTSFFFASGDGNPRDGKAQGFDSIFDNPQFAGGQFSYWQRQTIPLQGVNLTNRMSLVPDLRSSKFQGQANFVNPGLYLFNLGVDFDVTTKLKLINNCNFLWFDRTQVLQQFTFQNSIHKQIGVDLSSGVEYRPFLDNNVILIAGVSGLLPGRGFNDLYTPLNGHVSALFAGFVDVSLTF